MCFESSKPTTADGVTPAVSALQSDSEPQSSQIQQQFTELPHKDLLKPCTAVEMLSCSGSKPPLTDGDFARSQATVTSSLIPWQPGCQTRAAAAASAACTGSDETKSQQCIAADGDCDKDIITSTEKLSLAELILVTSDCQSLPMCSSDDTVEDVDYGASQTGEHSDLHLKQSALTHEVSNRVGQPNLPPTSNDLDYLAACDTSSVIETESRSAGVGFSREIETAVHAVEIESKPDAGLFHESEAFHTVDDVSCVETERRPVVGFSAEESEAAVHALDVIPSGVVTDCDSGPVTRPRSGGGKHILTASVNELPQVSASETVAHLASTNIHVTDELTVVNGIVQLAESPVKIGAKFSAFYSFCKVVCSALMRGDACRAHNRVVFIG